MKFAVRRRHIWYNRRLELSCSDQGEKHCLSPSLPSKAPQQEHGVYPKYPRLSNRCCLLPGFRRVKFPPAVSYVQFGSPFPWTYYTRRQRHRNHYEYNNNNNSNCGRCLRDCPSGEGQVGRQKRPGKRQYFGGRNPNKPCQHEGKHPLPSPLDPALLFLIYFDYVSACLYLFSHLTPKPLCLNGYFCFDDSVTILGIG